ncbi:endonuclease 8-like 1 isoform X2 [Scyliorhinus canicula]|uniref:endonuclease 8-like 1 isoform X2 n=1 Tax=Scyliorhinus canicula TaxID=7830 RepID=UPI0018F42150|nr:endonuclease 8-like 1 isoform X2 [Scyliorhinus canicula]
MPEGPELHLASRFVNRVGSGTVFTGQVEKSAVSKNGEVPFKCDAYLISAVSRGKEVKLTLTPIKEEDGKEDMKPAATEDEDSLPAPMDVTFRFGMSGSFKLTDEDEVPKHAHLKFFTKGKPAQVLCFVDPRRFGSWEVNGTWQPDRGPCVLLEYEKFRSNVLSNLPEKAFDKPICEVLLNQKYFNGIGNYLRAEILFRLKVPPFEKARTVLEPLLHKEKTADLTLSKKLKWKLENPDLLELCHLLPMEVINLGGKGYDPEHLDDSSAFEDWLRCYNVDGMQLLRDSNGRTIWFQGSPGPMAPRGSKVPKARTRRRKGVDENGKEALSPQGSESRKGKVTPERRTPPKIPKDPSQVRPRSTKAAAKQTAEGLQTGKATRRTTSRSRKKMALPLVEAPEVSETPPPRKSRTRSRHQTPL